MRGQRHRRTHDGSPPRLIPAHAGKTTARARSSGLARAHPRACGENGLADPVDAVFGGSSPRMRGKLTLLSAGDNLNRLIPACAGKTGLMPPVGYRRPAHPRVCGENSEHYARKPRPSGSSPRVRGKRLGQKVIDAERRLIPACAGKTLVCGLFLWFAWAHPRVCGENSLSGFVKAV